MANLEGKTFWNHSIGPVNEGITQEPNLIPLFPTHPLYYMWAPSMLTSAKAYLVTHFSI